jgi:hypothetical protein
VNVVETEQTDNAEPADDDIDERDVRVEFVEESPGYYTKGKQHHNCVHRLKTCQTLKHFDNFFTTRRNNIVEVFESLTTSF